MAYRQDEGEWPSSYGALERYLNRKGYKKEKRWAYLRQRGFPPPVIYKTDDSPPSVVILPLGRSPRVFFGMLRTKDWRQTIHEDEFRMIKGKVKMTSLGPPDETDAVVFQHCHDLLMEQQDPQGSERWRETADAGGVRGDLVADFGARQRETRVSAREFLVFVCGRPQLPVHGQEELTAQQRTDAREWLEQSGGKLVEQAYAAFLKDLQRDEWPTLRSSSVFGDLQSGDRSRQLRAAEFMRCFRCEGEFAESEAVPGTPEWQHLLGEIHYWYFTSVRPSAARWVDDCYQRVVAVRTQPAQETGKKSRLLASLTFDDPAARYCASRFVAYKGGPRAPAGDYREISRQSWQEYVAKVREWYPAEESSCIEAAFCGWACLKLPVHPSSAKAK